MADGLVLDPADRFLAHLTVIDRSPKTVRAYAHDLRDYFEFLQCRGLHWDRTGGSGPDRVPGSWFGEHDRMFRLGFGHLSASDFSTALDRLADALPDN